MLRDFPPPRSASWEGAARAWLAAPAPGAAPRLAATVLLLHDTASGPEVFVQRRVPTMEFAPMMHVFPGGGVDPADADAGLDPGPLGPLAAAMDLALGQALPVVAAAVREVEEECGVRLDPADLRLRAHWITPEFERRRYDTWIFATRLPPGQRAVGATTEADQFRWVLPADLLAEHADGRALLLPPTLVALEELARFGSVEEFLADTPRVTAVLPVLVDTGDAVVIRSELP
jgi:8-oxo-dGTP pyrophosphatase MutT (NUDIX family)